VIRTGAGLALAALLCLPSLLQAEVLAQRKDDGTLLLVTIGGAPARPRPARRIAPPPSLVSWIDRYASEHGLDPRLVEALIQVESGYDASALSRKGAMGLMQLMPETARELGVLDPWDAVQNLRGGTRYLKQLIDRFAGDLELALASYNAGPGAVERHRGVPPYRETSAYVQKVLSLYRGSRTAAAVAPAGVDAPAPAPVASGAPPVAVRGRPVQASRDARGHLVLTTPR
jgi:soluble lytic murein transglycosylase-like protein